MGPFQALDSVITKYFTLKGRASRSEYWWYTLMSLIILTAAVIFDIYLFDPTAPVSLNPLSYFTGFWLIFTLIPTFTVTVRRLHDSGKSGVWYLSFGLPVVGGLIWFITMILDSDHGENLYGPPPFGQRGTSYAGNDIDDTSLTPRQAAPRNPYAGYALLDRANQPQTSEMAQARKAEVSDYYRSRVLGQS